MIKPNKRRHNRALCALDSQQVIRLCGGRYTPGVVGRIVNKSFRILFLVVFIGGCASSAEVAQDRFDAGRQEQLAELERERGNEAMARIYEDSARRKRNTSSFLSILLGKIFD